MNSVLVARLSDRPPQDGRERSVEIGACLGRECISLPGQCDRVRKPAYADRDFESLFQSPPPRLQVGIAQFAEPWVIWSEVVEFLREAERHHQGEEGMRDRCVPPIDDAEFA